MAVDGLSLELNTDRQTARLRQEQADLLKMALKMLYATFGDAGMKSRIVMTVHDAVYVEAPEETADRAGRAAQTEMERLVEMTLAPLKVHVDRSQPRLLYLVRRVSIGNS